VSLGVSAEVEDLILRAVDELRVAKSIDVAKWIYDAGLGVHCNMEIGCAMLELELREMEMRGLLKYGDEGYVKAKLEVEE
jgi:hypothetical protein